MSALLSRRISNAHLRENTSVNLTENNLSPTVKSQGDTYATLQTPHYLDKLDTTGHKSFLQFCTMKRHPIEEVGPFITKKSKCGRRLHPSNLKFIDASANNPMETLRRSTRSVRSDLVVHSKQVLLSTQCHCWAENVWVLMHVPKFQMSVHSGPRH